MALEIASKEDFQRLENKLDEFLVELKLFNNRLLIPKVVTTKDIGFPRISAVNSAAFSDSFVPSFISALVYTVKNGIIFSFND